MDDRLKLLMAAIVIILVLLIGAYALGQNNSPAATPTPSPAASTTTPTPAPMPSGGNGTGNGTGTPAGTPTPSSTPAPTPTPTPSANPETESPQYNTYWPDYDFHWAVKPTPSPVPKSHGDVGFTWDLGGLIFWGDDTYSYELIRGTDWTTGTYTTNDTTIILQMPLTRGGDISGTTTVTVSYASVFFGGGSEVLGVSPAFFAPGETSSSVTVLLDKAYIEDFGGGTYPIHGDDLLLTIDSSPDYSVMSGLGEAHLYINLA